MHPFSVNWLNLLYLIAETVQISVLWSGRIFFLAVSSSSPACAILHPSDKLFSTLKEIRTLGPPTDITELQYLQTQCPMLFELFRHKNPIPKNALANAVEAMMAKAEAPFVGDFKDETPSTSSSSDMAFFPQLPVIHSRGSYHADRVRKETICTKHTTSHP